MKSGRKRTKILINFFNHNSSSLSHMELQQLNPSEKTPQGYTKLLDDEADSSVQPLSEKQEVSSSHIHQRATISEQNDQISSSESPSQKQIKELGSCFRVFYYGMLTVSILSSLKNLLMLISAVFDGLEFEKLQMFNNSWQLAQYVIAFSGVRTRNLRKISNAFFMMKLSYLFLGIILLEKGLEANNKPQRREEEGFELPFLATAVIVVIVHTIVPIWPTWRVKKIFETLPEGYNHAHEEQIRQEQEQAQGEDPIERLGSLWFKLYKYGLLMLFCIRMKDFVSGAIKSFTDMPRFLENLKSHPSFLVGVVMVFILFPLRSAFMFFVFEGFRRQSLKKMVIAIKIMKTAIWVGLICEILKDIVLWREGRFMESELKRFEGLEFDPNWLPSKLFAFKLLVFGLGDYFIYLFGALKARNVLKAHLEIKRTL